MTAVAHSLTSDKGSQLNGKECKLEAYDPVSRRYACKFEEDDDAIKLKAANLNISGDDSGGELFNIFPIIGKGIGVIARKPIQRFTRVIIEKPVLESQFASKQHDLDPEDISRQVDKLSMEDKQALASLSNSSPAPGIDQGVGNLQHHIRGIIENNVLGGKMDETKHSIGGIALCLKISRLNHSCSPNCEWRWNAAIDELPCVFAVRDIEAGEELTLSYVLPAQSRRDRRSELRRYCFSCECEACKSSDQDVAREAIEHTMTNGSSDVEVLEQALTHMQELNLAVPMYEAMFTKKLSEEYMRKGSKQKALAAAEKAVSLLQNLHGADSPVTRDALRTLQELTQ